MYAYFITSMSCVCTDFYTFNRCAKMLICVHELQHKYLLSKFLYSDINLYLYNPRVLTRPCLTRYEMFGCLIAMKVADMYL